MDVRVTSDVVVEVASRSARRTACRVLGAVEQGDRRDDDSAIVLGGGRGARGRGEVHLSEDQAERLLVPAIALIALERGRVPLHGATAVGDGGTTVVVGGAGSGKTAALVALARRGDAVFSPEWVVIDSDRRLEAVPGRLRLKPHHVASARAAGLLDRRATRARALLAGLAARAPAPTSRLRRALAHRAHVDVDLGRGAGGPPPRLRRILMLRAEPVDPPIVDRVPSAEAAAHVAQLVRADLAPLADARFGAPVEAQRVDLAVQALEARLELILGSTVPAWCLRHDHPSSMEALGSVVGGLQW